MREGIGMLDNEGELWRHAREGMSPVCHRSLIPNYEFRMA